MLQVRMSAVELEQLRELAERQGLTASDIVRQLVRREYEAAIGEKRKKPKH